MRKILTMALDRGRFDEAAEHARSHVTSEHIPCALLAVANREELLAIRSFNGDGEDDPTLRNRIFALASITKAIVGASVARLVDEGRLGYGDPIARHVPDFGTTEWRRKITIGDIFTHTTGLACVSHDEFVNADFSTGERFNKIFRDEPQYEPGTRMQYTTLTYQLINEIVRRLLGQDMSDFLREYVFEPCGMVDTAFEPADPPRAMPAVDHPMDTPEKLRRFCALEISGGGLWSTAGDLIKFAQAVLTPGKLMSSDTFRLHTEAQPGLPRLNGDERSCRTWGWNKEPQDAFPHQTGNGFYHGGATGTVLWLDPERDLIFVFLTNRWGSGNDHAFAVLNILYGQPAN